MWQWTEEQQQKCEESARINEQNRLLSASSPNESLSKCLSRIVLQKSPPLVQCEFHSQITVVKVDIDVITILNRKEDLQNVYTWNLGKLVSINATETFSCIDFLIFQDFLILHVNLWKYFTQLNQQARKARRCNSNLQSETMNHSLTHWPTYPLTDRGRCKEMLSHLKTQVGEPCSVFVIGWYWLYWLY